MTDNTYNGWSNYETWAVSLWLDNEEPSYRYWREQAEYHHHAALKCRQVNEGIWSSSQAAKFRLADQLKLEVTDAAPLDGANLYTDLLNAALSEVNWHEIAENMLIDFPPTTEEE